MLMTLSLFFNFYISLLLLLLLLLFCQLEINTLGDKESMENYREVLKAFLKDKFNELSPLSQERYAEKIYH